MNEKSFLVMNTVSVRPMKIASVMHDRLHQDRRRPDRASMPSLPLEDRLGLPNRRIRTQSIGWSSSDSATTDADAEAERTAGRASVSERASRSAT